ncbi:MAG: hypothetical protein AMK75_07015 [Planctomycetes bacterium SM23_65]|nr:MAG: hypothetical protein AMK75_07015 [Planctomycetes bacterium SM23_65]
MEVYGYEHQDDDSKLLTLVEVSFKASPKELRIIAQFFADAARLMNEHGDDFGHEHLKYHFPDLPESMTMADIIIAR